MIYVAAPYYNADRDLIQVRMDEVYKYMAKLTLRREIVVSPLLMHEIVIRYELPNNFDFWGSYSFTLLEKCSRIHILKLHGWRESRGVQAEIKFAKDNEIEISYIDVLPEWKFIDISLVK